MRLNLTQTPAVFSNDPVLAPHLYRSSRVARNKELQCKAWCVWLNSTPGIVAFLNTRQRNLTYPSFSLDGLRSLPAPNPNTCDLAALATAYDSYAENILCPLPEMDHDPVRHVLDDAVSEAVPEFLATIWPNGGVLLLLNPVSIMRKTHFSWIKKGFLFPLPYTG